MSKSQNHSKLLQLTNNYLLNEAKICVIAIFSYILLSLLPYVFNFLTNNSALGTVYRLVIFGALFALTIHYIIHSLKFTKPLIFIVVLYIFGQSVAFLYFLITKTNSVNPIIFLYSFSQIIGFIYSLFLLLVLSKESSCNDAFSVCCNCFIVFCAFCCFYSIIFQQQSIIDTFTKYDHSNYDVTSIFSDKNTFGIVLFGGSVFSILEIIYKKKHLFISFLLMFLIFSIISRTKTTLVLIFLLTLFSIVFIFCDLFKTTKRIFFIALSLSLLCMLSLLFLLAFKVGFFGKITESIFDKYGLFYDANIVIKERLKNWAVELQSFSHPFAFIFGFGERLEMASRKGPVDNSLIVVFRQGGIIKLFCYTSAIYFVLKQVTRVIKTRTKSTWHTLSFVFIVCAVIIYSMFGDYLLIGISYNALLFSIILVSPLYYD